MKRTVILILICSNTAFTQALKITFKDSNAKNDFVEGKRDIAKINARNFKNHARINNEFSNSKHDFLRKMIWIESIDSAYIRNIYNKLKNDNNIESIEIEPIYEVLDCYNPININDLEYQQQINSYHLDLINARCAWGITSGDPNVLIGVADTDINQYHEDLIGKIATTTGIVTGGFNHGTQVSGLITAIPNNTLGIAGVGYNLRVAFHRVNHSLIYSFCKSGIRPCQGCNPAVESCDTNYTATGSPSAAIFRSFDSGNKVINVSWSGSVSITDAINITNGGAVLVLAAGNTIGAGSHFGVADVPGVINVSGVNQQNMHGPTNKARNAWVDICAPSEGLITTNTTIPGLLGNLNRKNHKYDAVWGTSAAAPQVAAIVGLLFSANPCLTPVEVEEIIKRTADPIADADQFIGLIGAGRINAYKAVKETVTMYIQNTTVSSSSTTQRAFVDIGSNVTTTLPAGPVKSLNGTIWNINAREVTINGDFEIPLGAELNITTSPTFPLGCN